MLRKINAFIIIKDIYILNFAIFMREKIVPVHIDSVNITVNMACLKCETNIYDLISYQITQFYENFPYHPLKFSWKYSYMFLYQSKIPNNSSIYLIAQKLILVILLNFIVWWMKLLFNCWCLHLWYGIYSFKTWRQVLTFSVYFKTVMRLGVFCVLFLHWHTENGWKTKI